MSKLNFVERVKARIKGGEDASLMKLQVGTNKYLKKQIELIDDRIEDNSEKVVEKEEELNEYLETPNLNRINTSDARKQYIKDEYVAGYDKIVEDLDELKEAIETDLKLKEKRKGMIADLNKEVEVKEKE